MNDKQSTAISRLERQGWTFSNWISNHNPEHPEERCAIMVKHPHPGGTTYCEVQPDGTVFQ